MILQRVVSGMRPTGKLHLGHYHGVLKNWIQLQNQYQCYFFIADWHSLTTQYEDPSVIQNSIHEILLDWLAAGLDPEKATLFIQSKVAQHAELHLLLSMLTPISWLERVPTYKEMREQLQEKDLSTYGFLGYPVLQTADVALYQAQWVPVGQDQVVHIELSREILRRFNFLYGSTFTEPQPLLTLAPKLLGTDGRKMSKSYHNSIYLTDPLLEVEKKVLGMVTDPARKRRTDPGNPEICPVFDYHKIYTSENERNTIVDGCQTASMGCVDCKKTLLKTLVPALADHQTRRQSFEKDPLTLKSILKSGVEKASAIAEQSLNKVRQKMNLL